jgi:O-glycosyl hydrolase
MNKKIAFLIAGIVLASLLFTAGCSLEVNDPVREIPIITPYISLQPQSHSIRAGDYVAPVLTVQVWEWERLDGILTYQWYTFDTIDEFLDTGGTPLLGQTGPSLDTKAYTWYDPPRSYYFYVVVSNFFGDAIGKKVDSIQSDVAIVAIYGNSAAPAPKITRPPRDAAYTIGRAASVTPLEVKAEESSGNGTITYQWYSIPRTGDITMANGKRIEDENGSSYMPDISTLSKGDNYFYVIVTNTLIVGLGTRSTSVTCVPVTVTMKPSEEADAPKISRQPRDQLIFTDDTAAALKVEANAGDGGKIEIQWCTASGPYDTAARVGQVPFTYYPVTVTPIQGEDTVVVDPVTGITSSTFTPTIATSAEGVAYYCALVTNYNEDVEDPAKQRKTLRSKIVTVTVAEIGTMNPNAYITIPDRFNVPGDDSRLQFIRGYGGMDVAWANFPQTTKADTELMFNPDWGLGYNMLRIMIVPPGSTQKNFTNHSDLVYGRDRNRDDWDGWSGLTRNHRPDYINNVKVVNENKGYVLASPWTPPKEWKSNNSINSGGHLLPAYYRSFANYLREFCQFMYYQGAPIYAVSIANEPNYSGGYDGCEWKGKEMEDFFMKVGHFTDGVRGKGGGKSTPVVLTMNGESANTPRLNDEVLSNSITRAAVDVYARHVYGVQTEQLWDHQYASWKEGSPYETECWMTEHNINSANAIAFYDDSKYTRLWRFMNDVDLVVRLNHENAFVWWASKRFYSYIGDGQSGTINGAVLPRGYGLSHFAKYSNETRRIKFGITGHLADGTTEISTDTTNANVNSSAFSLDNTSVKITAFVSQDGNEISFVMFSPSLTSGGDAKNLGNVKITMPQGFTIGGTQAVKSMGPSGNPNETVNMFKPYTVIVSEHKDAAFVNLGGSQILSVKFIREGA